MFLKKEAPFIYIPSNTWYYCFLNCYSVTVIPPFPPLLTHTPFPPLPQSIPPIVRALTSSIFCLPLPFLSPVITLSPPLQSLLVLYSPLVLFCLFVCFVDQVPLIGEIIWYLSFITWLISLSIMLSSSIFCHENGQKQVYSCECAKQSLFLYYYLLILVLFST